MIDNSPVRGGRAALLFAVACITLAAAPWDDLVITGQILYGSRQQAQTGAEVDIVAVYASNPAFIRMQELGLSESDERGKTLFNEARHAANKALATVARNQGVDIITVPGGIESAAAAIEDLTQQVIELLPVFCVEGQVLAGQVQGAQSVAELDSQTVLQSIPAYTEWVTLSESDARYHILRKSYRDAFAKALQRTVRDQGLDVVAEMGSVTSRLGPVSDITQDVISVLEL